jgi:hypothetical protein
MSAQVLSPHHPDVLRRIPLRGPGDSGVLSSAPPCGKGRVLARPGVGGCKTNPLSATRALIRYARARMQAEEDK